MNLTILAAAAAPGGGSIWGMVAIYAAFIAILYFALIRPQRKQQKETEKMQNSLKTGDWVLLNNGMYGKIVSVVNDNLIVEFGTNKTVLIPVLRSQVASIKEPNLTEKTIDETAVEPKDDVVGDDLPEDDLDEYDKKILERGEKKKGLLKKK